VSQLIDQQYLQTNQYRGASNLNARIRVHECFSTNTYPWQWWVFDQLDLPLRCRILDLGCGPADLWLENGDRMPAGWTVVLSDLSLGMVQRARESLGRSRRRFVYQVVDAQALPFPNESFDAVVANHMLYHVPDRKRAIHEMHRVIGAGGRLYAATNGHSHLRELRDLVARFWSDVEDLDVAAEFGLENGAVQLLEHFAHVERHRQENALVVTEAEPLIAYAHSMIGQTALRENVQALGRSVRRQIAEQGVVRIQKDAGLFEARKA